MLRAAGETKTWSPVFGWLGSCFYEAPTRGLNPASSSRQCQPPRAKCPDVHSGLSLHGGHEVCRGQPMGTLACEY